MVGGTVIEVIVLKDSVWVDTQEPPTGDTCAIYVERNADSERIAIGDSLWWQSAWAMWTPASREFADRKIPRIGYSGVSRPIVAHVATDGPLAPETEEALGRMIVLADKAAREGKFNT